MSFQESVDSAGHPDRAFHDRRGEGDSVRLTAASGEAILEARRVLQEVFGFEHFRPGQEAAIAALLAGRNALTVMPTGSGKSLCFQIPALVMDGFTVVVSPLIALMQDQVAALRLAGVAADCINSSNDRSRNVAAWRRAATGETRLLYMAPERLMTERMLAALEDERAREDRIARPLDDPEQLKNLRTQRAERKEARRREERRHKGRYQRRGMSM